MSLSCLQTFKTESVNVVKFSPDDKLLAIGGYHYVEIRSVSTGMLIDKLEPCTSVMSIAFAPYCDNNRVAIGCNDSIIYVWYRSIDARPLSLRGHTRIVSDVVFSPQDKDILASVSQDTTARIWNVTTGSCLHVLDRHTDIVRSIVYSSDGSRVVTGSNDKTINIWDAVSGNHIWTVCLKGQCTSVAFSLDNRVIAAVSGKEVQLRKAATGAVLRKQHEHTENIFDMAFLPNGRLLATCYLCDEVKLWNPHTGACLTSLTLKKNVQSVVMSANGCLLAAGSLGGIVKIWDISSFAPETCVLTLVLGGRRRRLPHIPQELWQLVLDEFYL